MCIFVFVGVFYDVDSVTDTNTKAYAYVYANTYTCIPIQLNRCTNTLIDTLYKMKVCLYQFNQVLHMGFIFEHSSKDNVYITQSKNKMCFFYTRVQICMIFSRTNVVVTKNIPNHHLLPINEKTKN